MTARRIDARTARLITPVALAAGTLVQAASARVPTPEASPSATPAATVVASPVASPAAALDDTGIQRRISALLRDEPGVYGVIVARDDGSLLGTRNSDLPFMTASLYKLLVMADIYRKIEQGQLALDDPVELDSSVFSDDGEPYFGQDQIGSVFPLQEYLFATGAYSSNAGAWTLLALTSPADLADTIAAIGLRSTYVMASFADIQPWPASGGIDTRPGDADLARAFVESWSTDDGLVNITTPRDMAIYMRAMLTGTLLSPWISQQISDILAQQTVRDRIPALLPAAWAVINKTGNLESVINDAGIVELPSGPRIVILLAEAMPDDVRAILLLQRLALIATGVTTIPSVDGPNPAGLNLIDTVDVDMWVPADDQPPEDDSSNDGESDQTPPDDPNDGG